MKFTIHKNHLSITWLSLFLITITCIIIYSNIYHAPFVFDDVTIAELGSHYLCRPPDSDRNSNIHTLDLPLPDKETLKMLSCTTLKPCA